MTSYRQIRLYVVEFNQKKPQKTVDAKREFYVLWIGKYQYDIHKTLDIFKKREVNDINECSDLEILRTCKCNGKLLYRLQIYGRRSKGMESDPQKKNEKYSSLH